jgi:hypothetical protein
MLGYKFLCIDYSGVLYAIIAGFLGSRTFEANFRKTHCKLVFMVWKIKKKDKLKIKE